MSDKPAIRTIVSGSSDPEVQAIVAQLNDALRAILARLKAGSL